MILITIKINTSSINYLQNAVIIINNLYELYRNNKKAALLPTADFGSKFVEYFNKPLPVKKTILALMPADSATVDKSVRTGRFSGDLLKLESILYNVNSSAIDLDTKILNLKKGSFDRFIATVTTLNSISLPVGKYPLAEGKRRHLSFDSDISKNHIKQTTTYYTVIRSPFIYKKSREQFKRKLFKHQYIYSFESTLSAYNFISNLKKLEITGVELVLNIEEKSTV